MANPSISNNDRYQKPHDWGYSPPGSGSNNAYEMRQVGSDASTAQGFFEQV